MTIALKPVKSSAVEAIGYDAATREMHVRYRGGATYVYEDIEAQKHEDLHAAHSIGGFLAQHIHSRHRFRKVG